MSSNKPRLKAIITTSKTHFLQKAIMYQNTIKDAFKPHFTSNMSIFVPKLNLEFPKPCVMLYVNNGNGKTLIRAKNPKELADKLEQIALILRSDIWSDLWLQIVSHSEDLVINGEIINDNRFFDL